MHADTTFIKSKKFKALMLISFLTLSALVWFYWWREGRYYVSTDNAYINAHVIQIAPRVSGKVTKLSIANNQYVQKGQLLFEIDTEPYQIAVASAKAQVEMSEAQLAKTSTISERTLSLVKRHYLPPQEGDNAIASLKTALAQLTYAKTSLQQANLNLNYTHVVAPINGWVTNLSLREGDILNANQPLFALISDEEFWTDANFKETEIERIRPGQKAVIVTDLYPHHPFHGIVDSISGGAGSAFSLLPPQNATGNWVKVTQRIPIRIRILDANPAFQLRIGISAHATVHIHD